MDTMQTVSQVENEQENELKSERVEGSLTLEPLHIQLKSGWVEEAQPGSGEAGVKITTVWDLTFNQPQPVTIELVEPKVVIYLNGPTTEGAPAA
jgi:hypothetical protein